MKRNPDLLREIMLAAEKQPAGRKLYTSAIKTSGSSSHEVVDHVQQLVDIGYIEATVSFGDANLPSKAFIQRIRGPGHDFLQAMREDTVWKMAKEKVMIPTASWTLAFAVKYVETWLLKKAGPG